MWELTHRLWKAFKWNQPLPKSQSNIIQESNTLPTQPCASFISWYSSKPQYAVMTQTGQDSHKLCKHAKIIKFQGIADVITIQPGWNMNLCTRVYNKLCNSWRDISVKKKQKKHICEHICATGQVSIISTILQYSSLNAPSSLLNYLYTCL